jgi:hypothetical protein
MAFTSLIKKAASESNCSTVSYNLAISTLPTWTGSIASRKLACSLACSATSLKLCQGNSLAKGRSISVFWLFGTFFTVLPISKSITGSEASTSSSSSAPSSAASAAAAAAALVSSLAAALLFYFLSGSASLFLLLSFLPLGFFLAA